MADPGRRRSVLLVGVVVVAAVAALGGWLAGRSISSPDDVVDNLATPEPSLITVPVERRELASSVVMRGDVELEGSVQVELDSSVGGDTGTTAVVTGTPAAEGELVEPGSVLIEVGERPVVALVGELPMFRTLGPGVVGDDVEQFEAALSDLGFDPGPVDRTYDEATESAVTALYTQLGYPVPGLTDEERSQLEVARAAVSDAEESLASSRSILAQVSTPAPESARLQNQAGLDRATAAVDLAKAAASEAKANAAADVASAEAAEAAAAEAEATAEARRDEANAGAHPDTGEVPTPEELAEFDEIAAQASLEYEAATAITTAARATQVRVEPEQDRLIAEAETEALIAQALFNEAIAPPSASGEQAAVNAAQERLDQAVSDLSEIEAVTGVRVPKGEVLFLEILPRRVQVLEVERGDIVSGPVMVISGADITINSAVAAADRSLLAVGDLATADDESLGISFEAEITEIATEPGGRASEGRYFVAFRPTTDAGGEVANLNLRITVPITSTGGEVLTVPLAALSAGGDGSVRVEVETAPGVTRIVEVSTGLQTTGFVEVSPIDGDLEEGDQVVVGR